MPLLLTCWLLPPGGSIAIAQTAPSASSGSCSSAASVGELAAQPCLVTLVTHDIATGAYQFNGLELAAARANDAAYANLLKICGPSGTGCGAAQARLFSSLRDLEDNADELLGFGETQFSRHLPAQLLGFALRWTADEEYSAQSSLTNRLAGDQFSAVSNRLTALRFITQIQRLTRADVSDEEGELADNAPGYGSALGGAASADGTRLGQWSIFASDVYGTGNRAATTYNDAFDFGGSTAVAGADVHLSDHLVFGVLLSSVRQHVDFDSSQSIVSGRVDGSGGGVTAYLGVNRDAAYLNVSLGFERLTLHNRRVVTYASNNPQIPAVDSTFLSSTGAKSLLATVGGGYTFYWRSFAADPYLDWQYQGTHIGAFSESGFGTDPELATSVAGQSVMALEGIAGMKLQYAISPPFGVLLPYVYGEYRHEFKQQSQIVSSNYSASGSGSYALPTDSINPNYYEAGAGLIADLAHHLNLYAQYTKVLHLQYYTVSAVSGGFRYEF